MHAWRMSSGDESTPLSPHTPDSLERTLEIRDCDSMSVWLTGKASINLVDLFIHILYRHANVDAILLCIQNNVARNETQPQDEAPHSTNDGAADEIDC